VQRWKDYAAGGGHLVVTCRTGQKDRRGHLWEGPWAMPIRGLIGADIQFYDTLPAPNVGKVKAGNQTYDWMSWAEVLDPGVGTTSLAQYSDQFYAGGVAAVTRKLGKGTVTYLGVDSQDGGLEAQLIRGVFKRAGVPVQSFADGFLVDWRDGFWGATNFTEKKHRAPTAKGAKVLFGSVDVPTAGVTVWEE